ncbi:hypothetical protein GGR54DRAFT_638781 [Hypoxylon sp. NC1633]|nr:hypothetical protein GGR54DRAFT_638781 [Hypoxylon sp. NC1633]
MEQVWERVWNWVREDPIMFATLAVAALIFIFIFIWPALILGFLLFLLGFGPMGIIANSIASFVQSLLGNVPLGGMFAHFQSYAMGGYGIAILHFLIRILMGFGVIVFALMRLCGTVSQWLIDLMLFPQHEASPVVELRLNKTT